MFKTFADVVEALNTLVPETGDLFRQAASKEAQRQWKALNRKTQKSLDATYEVVQESFVAKLNKMLERKTINPNFWGLLMDSDYPALLAAAIVLRSGS